MRRLGICIAGLDGAVASTLVAGVALMRRGLARPVAVLSETFASSHGLAGFDLLVFGGWDVRDENLFESALRNRVIDPGRLHPIAKELTGLRPWKPSAKEMARDIDRFARKHKLDAAVVLNLLPTGSHAASKACARAAAETGSPFINFTPNDCGEDKLGAIPYCGRDGKTGQTWLKSVLAPALRARGLRVSGWYSTNLLGNEDGRVVSEPERGRAKISSKTKLLGEILGYEPHHQVHIHFYPPRGDNKESWDAIDFEGFLGLPMQLKINGLWRDSILAAPMCLDLVRFMDLACRRGERGPQEWLGFYFKSPYARPASSPPHETPRQEQALLDYLSGAKSATRSAPEAKLRTR